jgi:SPOR domain
MTKWIVGGLVLLNLGFFTYMQWGKALTVEHSAQATQAALNPDKMKLMDDTLPIATSAPVPVAAEAAPALPVKPVLEMAAECASWGDFSSTDAARAEKSLATLNLGERLTQRSVEHLNGYWVYIKPVASSAEIEKKVAQLKARGVTDYFVVQDEGKWMNAISLGIFKTSEAAQKYLVSLQAKNVRTAKMGEHFGKEKFTLFDFHHLDAAALTKIESLRQGFSGTELKKVACN